MFPFLSIATLPIQRWIPSAGAYVPCCVSVYVPFVRLISYQRTPACGLVGVPAFTDWFVTSASYVPKLRYARRQVGRCRYERMSRYCCVFVMPGCGRQSRETNASPLHG